MTMKSEIMNIADFGKGIKYCEMCGFIFGTNKRICLKHSTGKETVDLVEGNREMFDVKVSCAEARRNEALCGQDGKSFVLSERYETMIRVKEIRRNKYHANPQA